MRNIISLIESYLIETDEKHNQLSSLTDANSLLSKKDKDDLQSMLAAWATYPDSVRNTIYDYYKDKAAAAKAEQERSALKNLTLDVSTLQAIADKVKLVPGVRSANLWTKVPGKEAVYIELTLINARGERRRGVGGKFVFTRDGRLRGGNPHGAFSKWAADQTNADYHLELKTTDKIRNAIKEIDPRLPVSVS